MLTILLLLSTALGGEVPDFTPPDPVLLAALPAEQRERLLSAQIADNTNPEGEERLLVALLVSQRFGDATSADTPDLLPTLTAALSSDADTRGDALARAGSPAPVIPVVAPPATEPIQVSMAPRSAVLRTARGGKLPQQWRYLGVRWMPPLPSETSGPRGWVIEGSRGGRADALDVARVLQLQQHETALTARRRRMVVRLAVGVGVGAIGFMASPALTAVAPLAGLIMLGLGLGGTGVAVASPLIWKRQKMQLDRWYDRDDLLQRIEAHNLYWSSQLPTATKSTAPARPPR